MIQLYDKGSANYPRLETDSFFSDYGNTFSFEGFVDNNIRYIENIQLLDSALWERFVQQFREDADYDAGWRGEFWGKMMRGACLTYSYTRNSALYDILTKTVLDMLNSQDEFGRISSYAINHEFDGWDIWSRKYVLLGMQYYLEICTDKIFSKRIIDCMCRQVDYIISKIGNKEDGKLPITSATRHWRGLNSSSLLEPIVRLYSLTGKKEYFDFASYIVACGGTDVKNIFELAYENKFFPYQYPVTKAYEMISCFEGLLEYYRITKEEKYKTAVVNFADRILESDFTIIGSCGCTHELFDHSTQRQTNTTNEPLAQETCVTVTLMKFFYQMALITGKSKYVDAFEISMYNAYFGAFNTEKAIEKTTKELIGGVCNEPLPFDGYSPLTAGIRGKQIGGYRIMSDKHYYGCCACIGSAGNGLIPKIALLTTKSGFALNLFINGKIKSTTPDGNPITFVIETDYPKSGSISARVLITKDESFELIIRNPEWSIKTAIKVNNEKARAQSGFTNLCRLWKNGDVIDISLDMRTQAIYPIEYKYDILMNEVVWGKNYVVATYDEQDPIAMKHIALRRGPIILAQENRLGYSVDTPIKIKVNSDGYVDVCLPQKDIAPFEHIIEVSAPLEDGSFIELTDYASAGKLWNEKSKVAAWMLTE